MCKFFKFGKCLPSLLVWIMAPHVCGPGKDGKGASLCDFSSPEERHDIFEDPSACRRLYLFTPEPLNAKNTCYELMVALHITGAETELSFRVSHADGSAHDSPLPTLLSPVFVANTDLRIDPRSHHSFWLGFTHSFESHNHLQ